MASAVRVLTRRDSSYSAFVPSIFTRDPLAR